MSKHTKSPWAVHPTDSTIVVDKTGADVAGASGDYENNYEELEANARLIAASPELLEALKHAVRWHDQLSANDIKKMEAAIAKAEGRT